MTTLKHISFDLDGTLINSFGNMKIAWQGATEALHINCGFSEYRRYVGLPFPKIMEMLGLKNYTTELSEEYFTRTRALAGNIPEIPGAKDLVKLCRDEGYKVSIITSKPRKNSEDIVEKMGFQVDELICGDDFTKGKPDPYAGFLVCKKLGVTPAETLYVGDMVFDFQFALNAGMQFVYFDDNGANRMPSNMVNHCDRIHTLPELAARLA
ncbi:HAD family hydrolase [Thalassobius vesicularis]|uniref:phosphoglycolate phosphatase n=1 Tax=Thalassobius vesicularis TaxID=1294297 RepID=A0A4V3UYN0_9RHOB|nr:HAD family hydrolase [Thalassobius vesicularis]THD71614.1 HAD family hydrolase [Thalassobius vesicularis]